MNGNYHTARPISASAWVMRVLFCVMVIIRITGAQTAQPQWRIVSSPVRTDLNHLEMSGEGEGYAAGKYLLQCRRGVWRMMDDLPWTSDVNTFQSIGPRSIYASTLEPTNESFFYHFNGTQWRRIGHPLANFITAIAFTENGTGWLGGWGQMAYFNGTTWRMYPPIPNVSSVMGIVGTSDADLQIYTGDMGIYRLAEGAWRQSMPAESLHAFKKLGPREAQVIQGSVMMELSNGEWKRHSSDPMLASISSVCREPSGVLWGAGANGSVVRYDGTKWKKIPVPTSEQLNAISIDSKENGFILGNNGSILRLDRNGSEGPAAITAGFHREQIFFSGKGLDGEYGVAIEDVNGDGANDLYTVSLYNQNLLFINQQGKGGLFRDETAMRGAAGGEADTTISTIRDIDQGVGVSDLDNDGDREMLMCSLVGHNNLLLNKGGGYFQDVSHQEHRGTFPAGRSNSVSFADVDNDGDLDMFIANEMTTNRLFLNNGGGYFSDVTAGSGLETERGGICSTFGDIDGDGKADLVVTFWTDRCRLYKNVSTKESGARFIDITDLSGVGGAAYDRSNGTAFGDIDNDGDLDLFIAKRKSPNKLFRNDGGGKFMDISAAAIGRDTLISYGISCADLNNDGWLDLYLSNVGSNRLYVNNRNGTFTDRTFEYGIQHSGYNTGSAVGDVDGDGDIDLYSATYINGESVLFLNNINDSNFVEVTVEGTVSNRDAVGAVVRLYEAGKAGESSALLQYREVNSGSGYASHNALQVHFGADHTKRYDVMVTFPASGITRTIGNVQGGKRIIVREEEGAARTATIFGKFFLREVNDPKTLNESFKFVIMLVLCFGSFLIGRRRTGWDTALQTAVHVPVILLFILLTGYFYYEQGLLYVLLPFVTVLTILTIIHLYYERVVLKRIALREKENTRDQIARDLHDDIASTLSSATIYLNVLQQSFKRRTVQQNDLLKKINEAIGTASEGMTDIVWAIAPKHDTLGDLTARIRIMVADVSSAHSLTAEFRIDDIEEQLAISAMVRRNIFLIFKEGMNNIHKHAHARVVIFSVRRKGKTVEFALTDDGKGIPPDIKFQKSEEELLLHGNGLGNMKHRAQEIKAQFEFRSTPSGGTSIVLSMQMMHLHH
ncbi:MAG: FG-GAP-like repeat-containing protein [Bacteroidota bacterium]